MSAPTILCRFSGGLSCFKTDVQCTCCSRHHVDHCEPRAFQTLVWMQKRSSLHTLISHERLNFQLRHHTRDTLSKRRKEGRSAICWHLRISHHMLNLLLLLILQLSAYRCCRREAGVSSLNCLHDGIVGQGQLCYASARFFRDAQALATPMQRGVCQRFVIDRISVPPTIGEMTSDARLRPWCRSCP